MVFFGTILLGALVVFVNETYSRKSSLTLEPLEKFPYVVVYGNDQCSSTEFMRKSLNEHKIPFRYKNIDHNDYKYEMQRRLKLVGVDALEPLTPIVDVNANLFLQPHPALIIRQYKEFSSLAIVQIGYTD